MYQEEIEVPYHHIFLGVIQLKGIGFQTLYNFFHDGKLLYELMLTESIDEFGTILRRTVDSSCFVSKDWNKCLNELIDNGKKYNEALQSKGIKFLLHTDYQFPDFPGDMKKPIYWLFIQGKLENLYATNSLALIGSRESSPIGTFLAETLLFGLDQVKESVVTISGLAAGIDQVVHTVSLFLGIPTVAVLGNGIFENYPANSAALRQDILQAGGTIITEYFPDMKPDKEHFVNRNRIQAALASAVIPLEWKTKSGTAHTIRFAHEMQKQILFVETSTCRKVFSEHALANSNAQKKYGGKIFVLPNGIVNLLDELGLTVEQENTVFELSNTELQENKLEASNKPQQMGWNF